ncbi:MAG: dephospho-CoA kinase, partial [Chloroflexota bacterium]
TVMRLAEEKGALALDADVIVHEILATDPGVQRSVIDVFGSGVRQSDGGIDRAALAAVVFDDDKALRELELILHPRVRDRLLKRIEQHQEAVVFIEAIKLLEGGLAAECDQIWVTRCPVATQIERLMTYRDLDTETAQMRVNAQSDQELKAAAADVVIDTGGTLDQTQAYFEMAWTRLQRTITAKVPEAGATGTARQNYQEVRDDSDDESSDDSLDDSSPTINEANRPVVERNYEAFGEGIVVRRARPSDVPAIIELVELASQGRFRPDKDQLLLDLGQRGYLIGQQDDEISAIAGWYADNLVASIDLFNVHPSNAIPVTGAAVMQEVETTANELTCEVILAMLDHDGPAELRELLIARGFTNVVTESLPRGWQAAVRDAHHPAATVMMRVLRDTRQVRVRTIKEHHGQY